jgi:HSP20 family molecular chaperone IbpA
MTRDGADRALRTAVPALAWHRPPARARRGLGGYTPAGDVVSDEHVTVTMDVPGLQADDLHIDLENDVLTVRGERAYPYVTDGEPRSWSGSNGDSANSSAAHRVRVALTPTRSRPRSTPAC